MVSEVKNIGISKDLVKDVVIRTLRSRVEEINHKLKDIHDSMNNFERKYGMKRREIHVVKSIMGEPLLGTASLVFAKQKGFLS